ncbi:MAG: phosphohydrolase, partial [Bacteroidaceae bacterium]|nr:phosphohydrolase [Bacteroidaceae bacterium]
MVHDIGIFLTNAPGIFCLGTEPYICHGWLGAELIRREGFPQHALVCERHTGAGLSLEQIMNQSLPVPPHDMRPVSMEEQVICYADKFFSKTHPEQEKTAERALKSLEKFGKEGVGRFRAWMGRFGCYS